MIRPPPPPLRPDGVSIVLAATPTLVVAAMAATDAHDAESLLLMAMCSLVFNVLMLWRVHSLLGTYTEIGSLVFHLGMLFWFFLPACMTSLTDYQWRQQAAMVITDNRDAVVTFLAVNVFALCFVVGYQVRFGAKIVRGVTHLFGSRPFRPRRTVVVVALGFAVSLGFYVLVSGGIGEALEYIEASRSMTKPWSPKGNYGTAISPFHNLASSALVVFIAVSMHLVLNVGVRPVSRLVLIAVALVGGVFIALESGTRAMVVLATFPPLLLFYRGRLRERGFGRYTRVVFVGGALIVAIIVTNFQREYRHSGHAQEDITNLEVADSDFFTQAVFAVAVEDAAGFHTHDSVLLDIVTGPVPRFLWPGKPEMGATPLYSLYVWGVDITEEGGNALPSIVGQYFLSWGWFGVFEIGLVLGWLLRLGDQMVRRAPLDAVGHLGYAMFTVYVFVGFRAIAFSHFVPIYVVVAAARLFMKRKPTSAPAAVTHARPVTS